MKRYIIPAFLGVCLSVVSCKKEEQRENIQNYEVMTIGRQSMNLPESYTASIKGCQDVEIYPQVSGTISRICVTEGEHVKRGEVLFVIDQVPYQAALRTAIANVSAAHAKVETARLDVVAKEELFKENVISEYELATAKNSLAVANAELEQAKAQEMDARNSLSYTEVKSPVNGVVGTLPYRTGALVSPSMTQPFTTVSDNSTMYVYFSMNESRWRQLLRKYGKGSTAIEKLPEVELHLNDGSVYDMPGKIASVSGIVNQQTGSISIRCEFPNPDGELLSGSIGDITLPNIEENVITIPQRAANELQDKVFAFKVNTRDGNSYVNSVELKVDKITDGKYYVVRSGLENGDVIVANGVGLLKDGMRINVVNQKESDR